MSTAEDIGTTDPSDTRPKDTGKVTGMAAARLANYAATASVSVALTLVIVKTIAWAQTGSVALLGSLIDSGLDAAASGLNLIAVRAASQPADRHHRFGHGKIEAIAGLGQATLIAASALFLTVASIRHLIVPSPVEGSALAIGVIVFTLMATAGLIFYQRLVIARTGSLAIAADSLHYRGDLLLNASVIVALVLAGPLGLPRADALFGLIVAAIIGHGAVSIISKSIDQLLDREMSDEDRARIRQIALSHAEVRNVHDLRTRVSGYDSFIQLHIELDAKLPLLHAHEIADAVERAVKDAFPGSQVLIHEDPAGLETPPVFPPEPGR